MQHGAEVIDNQTMKQASESVIEEPKESPKDTTKNPIEP